MFGGGVMTLSPVSLPFLTGSWAREVDWLEKMALIEELSEGVNLVLTPRVRVRPGGSCCSYRSLLSPSPAGMSGRSVLVLPGHVKDSCKSKRTSEVTKAATPHNSKETSPGDSSTPTTGSNRSTTSTDNCCRNKETVDANNMSTATRREDDPWTFSVDLQGCDEVRATTKSDVLTVEGRGQSGDSQMILRHVTTLPHHVNPDTLTATMRDGHMTVSQRLASPVRVLPVATSNGDNQVEGINHHHPPSPQQELETETEQKTEAEAETEPEPETEAEAKK